MLPVLSWESHGSGYARTLALGTRLITRKASKSWASYIVRQRRSFEININLGFPPNPHNLIQTVTGLHYPLARQIYKSIATTSSLASFSYCCILNSFLINLLPLHSIRQKIERFSYQSCCLSFLSVSTDNCCRCFSLPNWNCQPTRVPWHSHFAWLQLLRFSWICFQYLFRNLSKMLERVRKAAERVVNDACISFKRFKDLISAYAKYFK